MPVKNSGPAFIGWGVALAVIGLVLALAISDMVKGVDLHLIGWILTGAGAVCALVGLVMAMQRPKTAATSVVEPTAAGGTVRQDVVEH